jgi:hypothetical protein
VESVDWKNDQFRIEVKNRIKRVFDESIRGLEPELKSGKNVHDGWEGHWLQERFGLKADAKNAPDLDGFELKDDTGTSVTTFGDWSADEYIFFSHARCLQSAIKAASCEKCKSSIMDRSTFLITFGTANPAKQNRFSWSGNVCPKVGRFNQYGQILNVLDDGSILAEYHFSKDNRMNKQEIIPISIQRDGVVLAVWHGVSLKVKLENKFKHHGWFKCLQESGGHGKYIGIQFGGPITFDQWIKQVRFGTVYFDSGMYEGNNRKYSQWRASNQFWTSLVEEVY